MRLTSCASLLLLGLTSVMAQGDVRGEEWWKKPFNGSYDPTNKNNDFGRSVDIPLPHPRRSRGDNGSRIAVQTDGIDDNGYVYGDSEWGHRSYTGERCELKRSESGRAFWVSRNGKRRWASPEWQRISDESAVRDAVERERRIANDIRRQQDAQRQQDLAHQQWQQWRQQQLQQMTAAQQQRQLADAEAARQAMLRQQGQNAHFALKPQIQNEQYSQSLGVFYQLVHYADGTFGITLTRFPEPKSPMRELRLEPGDTIWALDGQRFTRLTDLESHYSDTSVDFVNVRTNQSQQGNVFIK